MRTVLALTACLFVCLAQAASADILVSSNEGPLGQFVSGDVGTLSLAANDTVSYRVEHRPSTDDYVFTSLVGEFVQTQGFPTDAGITNGCTGLGTTTLTCADSLPGRSPYRIAFIGDTDLMDIALRGPGNMVTAAAFPATEVRVVGSNGGNVFENDTASDVVFSGGSSSDTYKTGTGVERVTMGAGVDILDLRGNGSSRCSNVTLDGVANDSVHQCNGSNLGAVIEANESFGSDIERVDGGGGADHITGNDLANQLNGNGGFDDLRGGVGDDRIDSGSGGARMTGGPDSDTFEVAAGDGGLVSYADKTAPVTADLDGTADDGTACPGVNCEGDKIDVDATGIEGGSSADTLLGAPGGKTLIGGPGGDSLSGGSGDDTLRGEGGNDNLDAFGGTDTIAPGPGVDTYDGNAGTDTLDYSESTEDLSISIAGGSGDAEGGLENVPTSIEDVRTGRGDDQVTGDGDPNKIFTNAGDDVLDGGGGADTLKPNGVAPGGVGGEGDGGCDVNRGGTGNDLIDVGPINPPDTGCRDVIDYSDHTAGVTVTLANTLTAGQGSPGESDSFVGIGLDVIGTSQADTISVTTATGEHTLDGRGGVDTLTGGPFDDTFVGGLGNDLLTGAGGSDTASYGDRSVAVTADLDGVDDDGATGTGEADHLDGIENLTGGSAADDLTGDGAANRLLGGGGDDRLGGAGGGDTIDGGAGANTVDGGDGDDDLTGGPSGGSTVDAGAGTDAVKVRNSALDTVRCGADADAVVSDAVDAVDADCESVDDGVPDPDPEPDPDPVPVPPAGGGEPSPPGGGEVPQPGAPAAPSGNATPPVAPPATLVDTLAPRVTVGPRTVRLSSKGTATLTVPCPRTETSCSGTVRLVTARKVARAGQPSRKARRITLGAKRFSVRGGATAKVTIKLKRADRALVKRAKRLAVKASAEVSDAAGNRGKAAATLSLRAPR
jgi:Ca2+-binding RTX toxin-like protein